MPDTSTPKKSGLQLDLLPPEKNLSRRGLQKFKENPFVDTALMNQLAGKKNITYTQTTANALYDPQTDVLTPAVTQIRKTIRADKENFVKIFTTHLKAFFELNQTAFKILQYVLHTVQKEAINTDVVYLSHTKAADYFESIGSKCSRGTYFSGMKSLVEKLFIAETTEQNLYYINPKLFFNGDRIQFITSFDVDDQMKLSKFRKDTKQIENDLNDEEKDDGI